MDNKHIIINYKLQLFFYKQKRDQIVLMMNFKSPYDSNQIRQGLMSIKQSQMQLLRQLKNENHILKSQSHILKGQSHILKGQSHILKKYTPQNPIYEQKSQSNLYYNSSPPYSPKSNFQQLSNQKPSYLLPNNSYLSNNNNNMNTNERVNNYDFGNNDTFSEHDIYSPQKSTQSISINKNDYNHQANNMNSRQPSSSSSYNIISTKNINSNNSNNNINSNNSNNNINSNNSNKNINSNNNMYETQRQMQNLREQYHRMKKNYFNEKQRNKDMILHMEFAASLHNTILRDILQNSTALQSIKQKLKLQIDSYKREFPQFKAFGIQQAFNIINLQMDISVSQQPRSSLSPQRRTQIFPTSSSTSKYTQQQNEQLLRQITDLKYELRQISLQKQRKVQQVRLIKSQKEYNTQMLSKQLQMKRNKIDQLVTEVIQMKQLNKRLQKENKIYQKQNVQMLSNISRLKSQLQRHLNKIQTLQTYQRQSDTSLQKQHLLMKKIQSLQQKITMLQKQTIQKSKMIDIHQHNIKQSQSILSSIKAQNQQLIGQNKYLNQQIKALTINRNQLQQQLNTTKNQHSQQLSRIAKHNQTQQSSLKQHIQQLKLNLQQLINIQHSYKLSQKNLIQIKQNKIQRIKLNKTVDHLWKIKQVEYANVEEILTQLNLVKIPQVDYLFNSQNDYRNNPNDYRNNGNHIKNTQGQSQQNVKNNNINNKQHLKRSSKSKSKQKFIKKHHLS